MSATPPSMPSMAPLDGEDAMQAAARFQSEMAAYVAYQVAQAQANCNRIMAEVEQKAGDEQEARDRGLIEHDEAIPRSQIDREEANAFAALKGAHEHGRRTIIDTAKAAFEAASLPAAGGRFVPVSGGGQGGSSERVAPSSRSNGSSRDNRAQLCNDCGFGSKVENCIKCGKWTGSSRIPAKGCSNCFFGSKKDDCAKCGRWMSSNAHPAWLCNNCGFGSKGDRCVKCGK